jgi:hypothetical protein
MSPRAKVIGVILSATFLWAFVGGVVIAAMLNYALWWVALSILLGIPVGAVSCLWGLKRWPEAMS